MKANVRGQIVVIYNDGPCCSFASSKRCKAICGESKCNIAGVRKIVTGELLAISLDFRVAQVMVNVPIKDVAHPIWLVFTRCTIAHLLCHSWIMVESNQVWQQWDVGESRACSALRIKPWLIAERAVLIIDVRANVATAGINTTIE